MTEAWDEAAKEAWFEEHLPDNRAAVPSHILDVDVHLRFEVLVPPWADVQEQHDLVVNTLARLDLDYTVTEAAGPGLDAYLVGLDSEGSSSRMAEV